MPIQQHHVEKLKQIILEENGKTISNEESWEMARRLYSLFRLLLHGVCDESDGK